jgi:hypothetical protein
MYNLGSQKSTIFREGEKAKITIIICAFTEESVQFKGSPDCESKK